MAANIARRRAGGWPVITMTQSGRDVLALLTAGPAPVLRSAALRLRVLQPEIQRIGVSATVEGLGNLIAARRGAELAASIDNGSAMLYDDLGPYGMLVGELPPGRALDLVEKTLGPVLSHDATRDAWPERAAIGRTYREAGYGRRPTASSRCSR